jgi:hypothetical protein
MQFARHSDPKLNLAVYGWAGLQDLSGAVSRLQALLDPEYHREVAGPQPPTIVGGLHTVWTNR